MIRLIPVLLRVMWKSGTSKLQLIEGVGLNVNIVVQSLFYLFVFVSDILGVPEKVMSEIMSLFFSNIGKEKVK